MHMGYTAFSMSCVSEKLVSESRPLFFLVEEVERSIPSRENTVGLQGEQGCQKGCRKKCVL